MRVGKKPSTGVHRTRRFPLLTSYVGTKVVKTRLPREFRWTVQVGGRIWGWTETVVEAREWVLELRRLL